MKKTRKILRLLITDNDFKRAKDGHPMEYNQLEQKFGITIKIDHMSKTKNSKYCNKWLWKE